MTVDVASLVFEFDSTQSKQVVTDLDKVAAAGDRVDASARRVKTATQQAGIGMQATSTATVQATRTATDLAGAQGAVEKATRAAGAASADARATRALEAAAMRELVLATKTYEAGQASLASKLATVRGALDPLAKIEKTRADQTAVFNKALSAGLVTEAQHAAGLKAAGEAALAARTAHMEMAAGVNLAEQAIGHMGSTSGRTREAMVLLHEFIRGDFKRGLGSAMIELQNFGLLGAVLSPIGLAFIAIGLALGGVVFAMLQGEREISKFNGALIATGNYAGLTASRMEAMSQSIANASDTTIGATKKTVESLAETGKFSGAAIASLADAAQNYSHITGDNADKFVKEYEGMGDSLVKFAVKHEDVYHDLTVQQVEQIALLVKHGKEQAAQALLAADIDAASKKRLADLTESQAANYGFLQTALHNVAINASQMWDALLGIGRPMTNVEKLGAAMDKLAADSARIQQIRQTPLGSTPAARRLQDAALAKDYANVSAAQAAGAAENSKAAADAAQAKKDHDAIQAKFGDGKTHAGHTPADNNATSLDTAQKAELAAQLALTQDVERVAKIKRDEVAAELKLQEDRLAKEVHAKTITEATARLATTAYQNAAAAKDELIDRQALVATVQAELDQRQAIAGYQDRINAAQAMFAKSAEDRVSVEEKALVDRQQAEHDALVLKLSENLATGKISVLDAAIQLSLQGQAQAAETAQKLREDDVKIMEEKAALAASSLQRDASILEANASLLTSTYARSVAERDILALTQKEALTRAQLAVDTTVIGTAAHQEAEDALAGLKARQAADKKLLDRQTDLVHGIKDATDAATSLKDALARHDWASVFDELQRTIDSIKASFNAHGLTGGVLAGGSAIATAIGGKTGNAIGAGLGVAGAGLTAGAFLSGAGGVAAAGGIGAALGGGALGAGIANAILGSAAFLGPIGIIAGIGVALASLLKSKPSNNAAIASIAGTSGFAISGDKQTSETAQAATSAAGAVLQGEQLLQAAGIKLATTVTKIDIGTRDLTHVFLSTGEEVRTAVGDPAAAAEAGLKAVLKGATFASDAEKKLVDSMLAAGKGFDDVATALQNFAAAQQVSAALADQILQLQDPKAFDLKGVHDAIAAQRAAAQAAATAGYLTADQLSTINSQLGVLEGLQIDVVLKRYGDAATAATDIMKAANDNVDAERQKAQAIYDAQVASYQAVINKAQAAADALGKFGDSLRTGDLAGLTPTGQLAATRAAFDKLAALPPGDQTRLDGLQAASEAFLAADKAAAPTQAAYNRDLAAVRLATDASAKAAQAQVSDAQKQIDVLNAMVAGQLDVKTAVVQGSQDIVAALGALLAAEQVVSNLTATANAPPPPPAAATDVTPQPSTAAATNDNQGPTATTPTQSPEDAYLARYSDVAAEANRTVAAGAFQSVQAYADYHYQHFGQGEGRAFATGAAFSNGVITRPTAFNADLMGEAGPEGILPLANVGGHLGVRSSGSNDNGELVAEVRSLRQQVEALTKAAQSTARSNKDMNDRDSKRDSKGFYVRGLTPDDPVLTATG